MNNSTIQTNGQNHQVKKLTRDTTFTHVNPDGSRRVRVGKPGTEYRYVYSQTETEHVHTAYLIGPDGTEYVAVQKNPRVTQAQVAQTKTEQTVESRMIGLAQKKAVRGVDQMETEVNRLSEVVRMLKGPLYMLIYDIPESLNSVCPNPSVVFWKHGYRLNKSCWVMTQEGLDSTAVQSELKHWRECPKTPRQIPGTPYVEVVEVECHIIKYADDQLDNIRQIAVKKLNRELIRIHSSLIHRIENAAKTFDQATAALDQLASSGVEVSEKDRKKPEDAQVTALRGALKDAMKHFSGALKSAEAFDDTDQLSDLFNSVREVIRAQIGAFNVWCRANDRKEVRPSAEML